MLLSETDAFAKQCRVLQQDVTQTFILSNNTLVPHVMHCAASACMHWRWGDPTYEDDLRDRDDRPRGDGWKWTHVPTGDSMMGQHRWRRVKDQRGYCGLAGKP